MDGETNSGLALKDYCDRWDALDKEKALLVETRKETYKKLSAKKLPVAEIRKLLAQENKDSDKLADQRDNLRNAGELMGVTVYTEAAGESDDPYTPETKAFAAEVIDEIRGLDSDIKELGEDIKDLLGNAKSDGFAPGLIPTCVAIRRDPAAYRENNTLLKMYLTEIGVSDED